MFANKNMKVPNEKMTIKCLRLNISSKCIDCFQVSWMESMKSYREFVKMFLHNVPAIWHALHQGLQTKARWPNATREAISSGPRSHFVNDENICSRKICWFGGMYHIPKQSSCVRRPALDMFCTSLCGPQTKKFGEHCIRR